MIFSLLEFAMGIKEADGGRTGYFDVLSVETKDHGWFSFIYIGNVDIDGKWRFDFLWLRALVHKLVK
jgi:hypothetical protein